MNKPFENKHARQKRYDYAEECTQRLLGDPVNRFNYHPAIGLDYLETTTEEANGAYPTKAYSRKTILLHVLGWATAFIVAVSVWM